MTNINCSLNCIYQDDGKCRLDNIKSSSISGNPECAYFKERRRYKKTLNNVSTSR